jgi:hypothetical protein
MAGNSINAMLQAASVCSGSDGSMKLALIRMHEYIGQHNQALTVEMEMRGGVRQGET